jgi:predicted RNase H-like HicB family nuclease
MTVEIERDRDNYWVGSVRHENGSLLDTTDKQGPGYAEVCEELGVILRAEVARTLENETADSLDPRMR